MPRNDAVNVRMNDRDKNMLIAVAGHMGLSMSACVKNLIRGSYAMRIEGIAVCAAGHPCIIPAAYTQYHDAATARTGEQPPPLPAPRLLPLDPHDIEGQEFIDVPPPKKQAFSFSNT